MQRLRSSSSKGRGWHGNSKGHASAGRLGGQATAKSQGETFYSDIGRIGGKKRANNQRKSYIEELV